MPGIDEVEYDWEDEDIDKYKEHMLTSFKHHLKESAFDVIVVDAVNAKIADFRAYYYFAMRLKTWTVRVDFLLRMFI